MLGAPRRASGLRRLKRTPVGRAHHLASARCTHMPLSRLFRLAALLVALATTLLVARLVTHEWRALRRVMVAAQAVADLRLSLLATEMVAREGGPANGLLGDAASAAPQRLQALSDARQRSDRALDALAQALLDRQPAAAATLATARDALAQARHQVDALGALPRFERTADAIRARVRGMAAVVQQLAPTVGVLANTALQALPALSDEVQAARLVAELRENAGLLGAHFTAALTRQQQFTVDERANIERTRGRIDELRLLIGLWVLLPGQSDAVLQAWQHASAQYFDQAGVLLGWVTDNGGSDGRFGLDPAGFAALYEPPMDSLLTLRDVLLAQASRRAAAEREDALITLWLMAAGSSLMVGLLVATGALLQRRILRPLAHTTQALDALARNEAPASLPAAAGKDEIAAVIGAVHKLQQTLQARAELAAERDQLISQLRDQSNTDFLTGLANRRAFFEQAQREITQAHRHGYGVVVILMDIDHFKQLNDQHGHACGDQVLVDIAIVARRALRQGDLVARHGGEEFVVLLSHADLASGLRFAERLREAIAASTVVSADGQLIRYTASLGVAASQQHGLTLAQLLSRADAAMYAAKQGGRNRVCAALPAAAPVPLEPPEPPDAPAAS